jgi:hypothetical protein
VRVLTLKPFNPCPAIVARLTPPQIPNFIWAKAGFVAKKISVKKNVLAFLILKNFNWLKRKICCVIKIGDRILPYFRTRK